MVNIGRCTMVDEAEQNIGLFYMDCKLHGIVIINVFAWILILCRWFNGSNQ